MTEVMLKLSKAEAVALTKARLEAVLRETQKDESKLKKSLELRRQQRRLQASKVKQK